MSKELKERKRAVYFRKSISCPELSTETVLTRDPFQFTELWLKRKCQEAIPYWLQAQHYYQATETLPLSSAPLTAYYCYLNAAKALLTVKKHNFKEMHGISGDHDPTTKRSLTNEIVKIKTSGILSSLSEHLGEPEKENEHSLRDILGNLPFIHRAYRHTYRTKPDIFIPVHNPHYRKHSTQNKIWVAADIEERFANANILETMPPRFERDERAEGFQIRSKTRKEWYKRRATQKDKKLAVDRWRTLHKECRLKMVFISSEQSLWYLKRYHSQAKIIDRYGLTLIMAAMHRLSELARYDPKGLNSYFEGKANWLLSEFIRLATNQFLDELVCEMTGEELRLPGIRS